MSQDLIDRIQQDAVTIQRLTAELDSIKNEQANTASEYKEKLQTEELRYSRLLSETTDKLLGCGRRIDGLEKKLDDVRKCARKHGWNEVYGWTDEASLCDFLKTALDVSQPGIAALRAQVEDLKAGEAESKAAAEAYGVLPDETHAQFIKRVLGDLATAKEEARRERERGNRINAGYEADIKKIMTTANELGRADYEAPDAFMKRQASEIAGLKTRIDKVIDDKTPNESLKYLYDCADKLGRGTTETIADFMKRQNEALDRQTNHISEAAKSLDLSRQSLQDKGHALLRMSAWHEENLQKIRELEGYSKRKDQTVARLQKVLTVIHSAAKAGGLKQGEKIGAFIERLNAEMYKLRCDAASESMKMGNANKQLQRSYDESRLRSAEELKTARAESLRSRTELSEIAKIVNPEGDNGPVIEFVRAISNQLTVSHKLHSAAVEERNNAQEEVRKLSAELAKETRRLREYEDDYAQIYSLAAAAGMQGNESVKQCLERKRAELSTVTADRDRIRAELAAILAEANKSGKCSGDPVALIRQGQADLDALTHFEKENAKLDELVSQLQGELSAARSKIVDLEQQRDGAVQRVVKTEQEIAARQQKADTADVTEQLRDAKQDYEIVRVQLDRIAKAAKRCGRKDNESVVDFMNRQQREKGDDRIASSRAVSLAVGQLERRLAEINAVANRTNRLACDPIALIIQGQRDHLKLVELEKGRTCTERTTSGQSGTSDLKEVFRLNEVIAELQVELDEARGKYSDIVAALENETLQQLIKRTDRSAKEQNASISAQLERLQKMFRQEMKDHQEAREAMAAAHSAASGCGMRDVESLPAFINRQFGELSEARNVALECGMRPEDNLRSFIYRSRRKLVDAMEAGDRLGKLASENSTKLDAALKTDEIQSAAIAEAKQATEKHTEVVQTAAKLRDWAFTIRHKVLVKLVHDKAMTEYDNIMKELDGKAGTDGR